MAECGTRLPVFVSIVIFLTVAKQMRNVGADQTKVPGLKLAHVVANESRTCTFINQYQFVLFVKMPWVRKIFTVQIFIYK